MKKIICPNTGYDFLSYARQSFPNWVTVRRNTRDDSSVIVWDSQEPTMEQVRTVWKDFCNSRESTKIAATEGTLLDYDNCILLDKGISFVYGDSTAKTSSNITAEKEWIKEVVEVVHQLATDIPIKVEFNGYASGSYRYIPTISLTPYYHWDGQGRPTLSTEIKPIIFKDTSMMATFGSYYISNNLFITQDYPDHCINTPWATVIKNTDGIGNRVIISSAIFEPQEIASSPSVYSFLKQPILWEKILIPMATLPFEEVREILDNVELPMALQIEMFKSCMTKSANAELTNLLQKQEKTRTDIEAYIRNISTLKVTAHNISEQIIEKQTAINKKFGKKQIETEIEKLSNLPYLKRIRFSEDSVEIITEPIQIDSGPVLGGYKIVFKSENKTFTLTNIVNPLIDYNLAHPHCEQGHAPCFGNYTDVFYHFEIGNYLIGLELLHAFLSTYNPEDTWGRRLIYWDAEFVFNDMRDRGLLNRIESKYDSRYFAIYGEHLSNHYEDDDNVCPECGEHWDDCECERCQRCDEIIDRCGCDRCGWCGGLLEHGYGNDCGCDRCIDCGERVEECSCERCDVCDERLENCECSRCVMDDSEVVSEENCFSCETTECSRYQELHPDEDIGE